MYHKRIAIIGYKPGSGSVRELAGQLGKLVNIPVLRVRKDSKYYQPRYTDYIINWGCSKNWEYITHDTKDGHQRVVNKLDFFKCISNWNVNNPTVNIPEWTTDFGTVIEWITKKKPFFVRHKLNGHSGEGIEDFTVECTQWDVPPDAPLYVQYKKKKHEFRVHVFNGKVIDVTQKKKRKGFENVNTKIRNHANGWVYCRDGVEEPNDLCTQALTAMLAVDLKFGAVDLIYNELENKCYVLEINTAPGLIGTTLDKYVQAFIGDLK